MPEELALQELVRHGPRVLGDEGLVRPGAVVVQGARQQLLAGAGFAGQQHRDVIGRDLGDLLTDTGERARGAAHHGVQIEAPLQPLALLGDALLQRLPGHLHLQRELSVLALELHQPAGVADDEEQIVRVPGLGDVLVDTGAVDPLDDVLGLGVAGDDDARHVRPALAHPRQQLDPGHGRHALIRDHDLNPLLLQDALGVGRKGRGADIEVLIQDARERIQRERLVVDQ